MIREGRMFGFALGLLATCLLATPLRATAGDKTRAPANSTLSAGDVRRVNSDVRARILTPELRSTPLVGWIAANLYRDKDEKGWCLEADPGQGEYIVFYRLHFK